MVEERDRQVSQYSFPRYINVLDGVEVSNFWDIPRRAEDENFPTSLKLYMQPVVIVNLDKTSYKAV